MTATCRSCGAPIIWSLTQKGKRMPLDEKIVGTGLRFQVVDGVAVPCADEDAGHASHFATCEFAAQHRRAG